MTGHSVAPLILAVPVSAWTITAAVLYVRLALAPH